MVVYGRVFRRVIYRESNTLVEGVGYFLDTLHSIGFSIYVIGSLYIYNYVNVIEIARVHVYKRGVLCQALFKPDVPLYHV